MAREISWKALTKRADPKPEPPHRAYDFKKPKYEKPTKPGQPYGN